MRRRAAAAHAASMHTGSHVRSRAAAAVACTLGLARMPRRAACMRSHPCLCLTGLRAKRQDGRARALWLRARALPGRHATLWSGVSPGPPRLRRGQDGRTRATELELRAPGSHARARSWHRRLARARRRGRCPSASWVRAGGHCARAAGGAPKPSGNRARAARAAAEGAARLCQPPSPPHVDVGDG